MLAILNSLSALELVILGNQLAIPLRKLVQAEFQALHFIISKFTFRRSRRRNILVFQRLRLFCPAILEPDFLCNAATKGDWFAVLSWLTVHNLRDEIERFIRRLLSMRAALPDEELHQCVSDVQIFSACLLWSGGKPEKKRCKHLRCQRSLSFRIWRKFHGT